ncbi:MAG: D-cysteine desulfhydrase family protein [Acidimicrobiia bacterium]
MKLPPRHDLAFLPTPLHPLDRLAEALALPHAPRLWIKRDDQTGLAAGGNKARKLEFLVADALAAGADALVTAGGRQSNHARQTAAAGRASGFEVHLVLNEGGEDPEYRWSGNVLLDRLLGAHIHPNAGTGFDADDAMADVAAELRRAGRRPYVIPPGGSSPVGAVGYVDAARELLAAAPTFGCVVHASGSGGTQAGLLAGFAQAEAAPPVLGISVARSSEELAARVLALAGETVALIGGATPVVPADVVVDDGYVGPGYGVPTDAMVEAVGLVARTEGVLLDPVYTGKAMAGLVDLLRAGRFDGMGDLVFLHTGGLPGLFAYRTTFE